MDLLNFPYHNEVFFIATGMLGGVAHYLKKVLKKETDADIFGWFGKANVAASIYTLLVFMFTMIGALATDIITAQTGFFAVLYTGFITGFAIDAGFNSDKGLDKVLEEAKGK